MVVFQDQTHLVGAEAEDSRHAGRDVVRAHAEPLPGAEREAEVRHDCVGHAVLPQLVEGDAHGDERLGWPPHAPDLAEVGAEVVEGMHGEVAHVADVAECELPALDPLLLVGLELPELLRREAVLDAQPAPGQRLRLHVLPREVLTRLVPPPEDADRLRGRELNCMHRGVSYSYGSRGV